jgi:hypothetical protein
VFSLNKPLKPTSIFLFISPFLLFSIASPTFLASKAFLKYRQLGGAKTSTLPDFLIGAHATFLNIPLIINLCSTILNFE